jgi:hypothetical protein
MLQEICSPFIMLGIPFACLRLKWSGGNLYGINMLFYSFLSPYGLQSMTLLTQDKLMAYGTI